MFELYYKMGQNSNGDLVKQVPNNLTEQEMRYMRDLAIYLGKTGKPNVATEEGLAILISGFLSGVGYAGAHFGKENR